MSFMRADQCTKILCNVICVSRTTLLVFFLNHSLEINDHLQRHMQTLRPLGHLFSDWKERD